MKLISTSNDIEENIQEVEYSDTLESCYLDYSMSVIVSRAVPDLRDGLKPVQRKILYDMKEMGCYSDKPYKKTARVSGDVIGKYHPHGSAGVEEAIVTMAQKFKKPITFIEGQGNFGSIEGDGAAAARYTEIKLTSFSEDVFLNMLNFDTVKMVSNYDETLKEPEILPSILPTVLITGAEGIAVGMKTNIPTYNLSEIIDANICVLENPDCTDRKILNRIPGPDFCTGGYICNKDDLNSIQISGTGKIRIRGKIHFEPGTKGSRDRFIISEIPYTMVGKSMISFLQDIAELVENKTITGIYDILNQTSDTVRIVIELEKGADIDYIRDAIVSKTKFEDTLGVNILVVSDGRPEVVGIPDIIRRYSKFQKKIFYDRFKFDLERLLHRKEILEGYIICIDNIDDIVNIIKHRENVKDARSVLHDKYDLTYDQCDSILGMKLSKLVGLEQHNLDSDLNEVKDRIDYTNNILENESELISYIIKTLRSIKKKYGYLRRTVIDNIDKIDIESHDEPEYEVGILMDRFGYIHQMDSKIYDRNLDSISKDFKYHIKSTNKSKINVFCDNGNMYRIKAEDIPYGKMRFKGQPLENLCPYNRQNDTVINVLDSDIDVITICSNGLGKRLNSDVLNIRRKSTTYILEGSKCIYVQPYTGDYITLISSDKRSITFSEDNIKSGSRGSRGTICMRFKSPETYVKSVKIEKSPRGVTGIGSYGIPIDRPI